MTRENEARDSVFDRKPVRMFSEMDESWTAHRGKDKKTKEQTDGKFNEMDESWTAHRGKDKKTKWQTDGKFNEMDESLTSHRGKDKKTKEQTGGKQPKVSDYVVYIPSEIFRKESNQTFLVGRFLGKGSYAKCFEVTNKKNGNKFACKILSKNVLFEEKLRKCVRSEIDIHSHVAHDNITQYVSDFCDEYNLYLVLELCAFKSLKEMQSARGTITEIECRYILHEILMGVRYLHQLKIVHRDLKLSNIFLAQNMSVKIGDFGLAARLATPDGLLYSTCGTANYFSPEIVKKTGYAYEVDVWCIGVIMYLLLVGRLPFEGDTMEELFYQIEACEYDIPTGLSGEAAHMLAEVLQENRYRRPTADQCLQLDFIHGFILPRSLPVYSLLSEPRPEDIPFDDDEFFECFSKPGDRVRVEFNSMFGSCQERNLNDIDVLCQHLFNATNRKTIRHCQLDEMAGDRDALQSKIWVKKWMYERKSCSAFAYQLNDESIGIFFDDRTKFCKFSGSNQVDYIDARGHSERLTTAHQTSIANFKVKWKLFKEFNTDIQAKLKDWNHYRFTCRISSQSGPTVHSWFTTAEAIVIYLTDGIVQINFLDHFKLILDPREGRVTIIAPKGSTATFSFAFIESNGISFNIHSRLKYALVKVKYLMGHLKKSKGVRQKLI